MIIEDYNFSMQFWVSGGEINGSEAPALFSITDNNETKLALYRDPNINNSIICFIVLYINMLFFLCHVIIMVFIAYSTLF